MTSSTFQRPPTAQVAVLAELRRVIAKGQLRPGEQIVQDTLALELGVSRLPLREALKILEGEGQVIYRPHRGYFVAELSLEDFLEVYRLRDLLETEAVRVGLAKFTEEDTDRIIEAQRDVEAAARATDVSAMVAANRRFHLAILQPCGMSRLNRFIHILWDATEAYRSVYYNDESHRHLVIVEHQHAVDAIVSGDTERLVEILAEHRRNSIEALTELLELT
jgi:DNA-binding GntR family transcriptional regulator